MVVVLDSGSIGPGSSPGQGHHVVVLGQDTLSTWVYKWVPSNLMLVGNQATMDYSVASHPGGSRNISSHFMVQKPR